MDNNSTHHHFNPDEVREIVQQVQKQTLGSAVYQSGKVDGWISAIVEGILKRLQAHEKPFKYLVSVVIMQRAGSGLHSASQSFWDTQADAFCTEKFENASLQCCTTVFGIHI